MRLGFTLFALVLVAVVLSACKSGPYTYTNYLDAIHAVQDVLRATPELVDAPQCLEFVNHGLWQAWEINGGWAVTADAILLDKVDSPASPSGYRYTVRPGNGVHFGWKFSRTKGLTQIDGTDGCTLLDGQSYVYPATVVTGR